MVRPRNLLLTVVFAVPGFVLYDGLVRTITIAGVALAVVYTAVRKRVPDYMEAFVR